MPDVDAIIVGGGPAGLAAAMSLGRARRSVLVIDAGDPAHFAADAIHNVVGFDGVAPREFRATAWRQLEAYDVRRIDDMVVRAESDGNGFAVVGESSGEHRARAVVLAGGQRFHMPHVRGLQQLLGTHVFHCPFCHGWEVGGGRIAYIGSAESLPFVDMLRLWSDDVTFVDSSTDGLEVQVVKGCVSVRGEGVDLTVDAVFAHPHLAPVDDLPEQLGLARIDSPMSTVPALVPTLGPPGATFTPGVFVAGDLERLPPTVAGALASGSLAGGSAAHFLAQAFAAERA